MDRTAIKYIKGQKLINADRAAAVMVALREHLVRVRERPDLYGAEADAYHAGWRDALLAVSETATILQAAKSEDG